MGEIDKVLVKYFSNTLIFLEHPCLILSKVFNN
ncbi:MAG: hypothetical protein RL275_179 [Chloroflexota bacterium]|jgi:hypothetical protein